MPEQEERKRAYELDLVHRRTYLPLDESPGKKDGKKESDDPRDKALADEVERQASDLKERQIEEAKAKIDARIAESKLKSKNAKDALEGKTGENATAIVPKNVTPELMAYFDSLPDDKKQESLMMHTQLSGGMGGGESGWIFPMIMAFMKTNQGQSLTEQATAFKTTIEAVKQTMPQPSAGGGNELDQITIFDKAVEIFRMGQDSNRSTGPSEPPKGKHDDLVDGILKDILEERLKGGGGNSGPNVELEKARWEHEDRKLEVGVRLVEAKYGRKKEDKIIDSLGKLAGVAEEVIEELAGEDDEEGGTTATKMKTKGRVQAVRKDAGKVSYFKCLREGCNTNIPVAPGAEPPYVCGKCGAGHEPDVSPK